MKAHWPAAHGFRIGTWRTAAMTAVLAVMTSCSAIVVPAAMAVDPPVPQFWVGMDYQGVSGEDWPAGLPVTVTADNPATGPGVDITFALPVDGEGRLDSFEVLPGVAPGWVITVTSGDIIKTHVVKDVRITDVDVENDVVRGTTSSPDQIWCNPFENNNGGKFVGPIAGQWEANFTADAKDITLGCNVGVQQEDIDGDSTYVSRYLPRPVGWQYNSVTGHYYLVHENGMSWQDAEDHAIQHGGHLVTINDEAENDWLIDNLGTGYCIGLNDLAEEGAWEWASGEPYTYQTGWIPGEPNNYNGVEDVVVMRNAPPVGWNDTPADGSQAFVIEALVPASGGARIGVSPDNPRDHVWGDQWIGNSTLSLTIEDPATAQSPDFEHTFNTDWDGYFELYDLPIDIKPGQIVTVGDGTTTKTVTVDELGVDDAEAFFDTVSGRASPGSEVTVELFSADLARTTVAAGGLWSVDFTLERDLTPNDFGWAYVEDEDGDLTQCDWRARYPQVVAHIDDDHVSGWGWKPGEQVTITVEDPLTPLTPDFQRSVQADEEGNIGTWDTDLGYGIKVGDVVAATQGPIQKSTTVKAIAQTAIDLDADTVSGTADTSVGQVGVEVHAPGFQGWVMRWADVHSEDGTWSADFTTTGPGEIVWDVKKGTGGAAFVQDEDFDRTQVGWYVPDPNFSVEIDRNLVNGADWGPGSVDVKVYAHGYPGEIDHQLTAPVEDGGNIYWTEIGCDVEPGDVVVMDQGETHKELTLVPLAVSGVGVESDTVTGTAEVGTNIIVVINDTDGWVGRSFTTTEPVWTADFGNPGDVGQEMTFDIVKGTGGSAFVLDTDGDQTMAWWSVPDPRFSAHIGNGVDGWGWWPNSEVTITTPRQVVTVHSGGYGNFNTWDLEGGMDIRVGDLITVTDGHNSNDTTVVDLAVSGFDTADAAELVTGTVAPGKDVMVEVYDTPEWVVRWDTSRTGTWSVSFATPGPGQNENWTWNLEPGANGAARVEDDEGDCTQVDWHIPKPTINAHPDKDQVDGWGWKPGAQVTIKVGDPANPLRAVSVTANEWGEFGTWENGLGYDLVAGNLITVSDGVTTKSMIVAEIAVSGVDLENSVVFGTAAIDAKVDVSYRDSDPWVVRSVVALDGTWSANLKVPGTAEGDQGTLQIQLGMGGVAQIEDPGGHWTMVDWYVPNPNVVVHRDQDRLDCWDWKPSAIVTATVGDLADPVAQASGLVGGDGYAEIQFENYDIKAGDHITVTDGHASTDTTVTAVAVTAIDAATNVISGTAEKGTRVVLEVWDTGIGIELPVNDQGLWSVDLDPFDLEAGAEGAAYQWDGKGNRTFADWRVPNPGFNVYLNDDRFDGWEWTPSSTVTITVGSIEVTATTDEQGNFGTDSIAYDVKVGDVVSVTDGVTLKDTTVVDLAVTELDASADTVSGTCAPGKRVSIEVYTDVPYRVVRFFDAVSGTWTADFSKAGQTPDEQAKWDIKRGTDGSAWIQDPDGDATKVEWHVPNPCFAVSRTGFGVGGWEWAPSSTVTITVDNPVAPYPLAAATTNERGEFFTDEVGYELSTGDVVTVTDGSTIKSTTIVDLAVTQIDLENNLVSGTRSAGTTVTVEVYADVPFWVARILPADGTGWTADFTHVGPTDQEQATWDIVAGTEGSAWTEDSDGDQTRLDWRVQPPVTVPEYAPARPTSGWWSRDVTLTLSAESLSGLGVERIDYSITTPSTPKTSGSSLLSPVTLPTFTEDGTSTVTFFATDRSGGVEAEQTVFIRIDKTPPPRPGAPAASDITQTSVVLNWDAVVDATSGTTYYQVYKDGAWLADVSGTTSTATGLLGATEYSFTIRAVDAAGNASESDATLVTTLEPPPDSESPTIEASAEPSTWTSQTVVASVNATDNSGSVTVTYTVDSTEHSKSGASPLSFTFEVTTQGDRDIPLTAYDARNNRAPGSVRVKIDKAPPVVTPTPSGTDKSTSRTVSLLAEDALSGLAHFEYKLDDGTTQTVAGGSATTPAATTYGTHTVAYYARDVAGNVSEATFQFFVDENVPPTTSIAYVPLKPASGWWNVDVTLTLTAVDTGGSGVDRVYYVVTPPGGLPDGGWSTDNPFTYPAVSSEGTTSVGYWSADKSGNEEAVHNTAHIQIDKTPPLTPSKPSTTTAPAYNSVSLFWSASTDALSGVVGYQVFKNGAKVADVMGTACTVSTGISGSTTYSFTVVAVDAAGNVSPASDALSVTTPAPPPPPPPPPADTIPPVVTVNAVPSVWTNGVVTVTVSATDDTCVTSITWGYGPAAQVAYTGPVTVDTEGITTVNATAKDDAGNAGTGAAVARIDRTTPPAPGAPNVLTPSATSAALSWGAVSDALSGVASYDVYDGAILLGNVTGTTYTKNALAAGSAHVFSLVAIDAAGNRSAQGAAREVTMPTGNGTGDVGAGANVTETVDVPAPGGGTLAVTAVFSNVTVGGGLVVTLTDKPPAPVPSNANFMFMGSYWDVSFDGSFTGSVKLTFPYDPKVPDARARNLKLMHWTGSGWESVPVVIDLVNHTVTGTFASLSPIALAEPLTVDRSTKLVITKRIVPTAYGKAAGVVATLSDASGTVLPGRTVVLETSVDNVNWSLAATMTATPGKPGSYTGTLRRYRTAGRTYVRVRFVGDSVNDSSASSSFSFLPKARILFTPKIARRVLTVTGSIAPKHAAATTVKVTCRRIVAGKVKATKTLTIRLAVGKTAFSGRLALTAGTWKVTITHSDATHASSASVARTVVVR